MCVSGKGCWKRRRKRNQIKVVVGEREKERERRDLFTFDACLWLRGKKNESQESFRNRDRLTVNQLADVNQESEGKEWEGNEKELLCLTRVSSSRKTSFLLPRDTHTHTAWLKGIHQQQCLMSKKEESRIAPDPSFPVSCPTGIILETLDVHVHILDYLLLLLQPKELVTYKKCKST